MNLSKIAIGLMAFCVTLPAMASSTNDQHYYAALYAGLFRADINNTYLDQTNVPQQNIAQGSTQHGYIGGFAVGNSVPFGNLYFAGGEIAGNLDSHMASFQSGASNAPFSDNVQVKNHFDVTVIPGVGLTDTVGAYIKLGLTYASVQDTLTSPVGAAPSVSTNYNSNKHVFGAVAGLGLEKFINDRVFLFLEGIYHDYGTVDFSNFQNLSSSYTHSGHLYTYSLAAGAGYTF